MIDKPTIAQSDATQAAVIRFKIPKPEIHKVMGPGFQELMGTVAAQGIEMTGPAFSHHFRMDPDEWDFEIGVPVKSPVAPAGRVKPGSIPAAKVARTVYHGGYDGLAEGWGQFDAWMKTEGLVSTGELWEFYSAGPESGPDPSKYRTELNRPLAG
jgi:effector-binding domain-containing protein